MKAITLVTVCALAVSLVGCGLKDQGSCSPKKLMGSLSLEEKVCLLVGAGLAEQLGDSLDWHPADVTVPGAAGTTCPVPRLGIPAIVLADGPAGVRIAANRTGDSSTQFCTAFPIGSSLAASWDDELVEAVGAAIGKEALDVGVDVLLAPGLNLHRNPLCGRNFEYYSEDPLLAGRTAAAYVRGVQSNGVGATIKHFAANNQETNRQANDARVSLRALRELYLKAFEIAVNEGQPWAVMTSYNKLNGEYTSESKPLITELLRKEWKYKGVVMTDWFAGKDPVAQVASGHDLLMPGRAWQYEALLNALKDTSLSTAQLDAAVERVLCLVQRTPKGQGVEPTGLTDLTAHAALSRRAAAEGMVLLENKNHALPLREKQRSVALFGVTSHDMIAGGTGSGDVNKAYTISLPEAFTKAGFVVLEALKSPYLNYIDKAKASVAPPAFDLAPVRRVPEWLPPVKLIRQAASMTDVGVITLGRSSGEFADRRVDNDFNLTKEEQTLLKQVCEAFREASKPVVVVLNVGGVVETASWKEWPDAILLAWQPGQEAGHAVVDVLKGTVNPSGKLPMTFPLTYADVHSAGNFPDGLTPSTPGEPRKNVDYTLYEEGLYLGYRYVTTFNQAVAYPFGFGLSYTSFVIEPPVVTPAKGGFVVKVRVSNRGRLPGREVVQLYVTPPTNPDVEKPMRELKAFRKTILLQPGERELITFQLSEKDLAYYDPENQAWTLDKGLYSFDVGSSSKDIAASALMEVKQKTWKTSAQLPVSDPPLTAPRSASGTGT